MAEEELRCARCGTTENLIHHHDSYEPEVVRVLCRSCHKRVHNENPNMPKRPKGFQSAVIQYPEGLPNISITIEKEQLEWLEDQVREGKFASISHGIRVALNEQMKKEK